MNLLRGCSFFVREVLVILLPLVAILDTRQLIDEEVDELVDVLKFICEGPGGRLVVAEQPGPRWKVQILDS